MLPQHNSSWHNARDCCYNEGDKTKQLVAITHDCQKELKFIAFNTSPQERTISNEKIMSKQSTHQITDSLATNHTENCGTSKLPHTHVKNA